MNNPKRAALLLAAVMVVSACASQKPPKQVNQPTAQKPAHKIRDVRLEFLRQPPRFNEAELEVIKHTRETISHYLANPNDFYISAITIGLNSIWVYVDRLEQLQSDYRLYFADEGPQSASVSVMADDSFRPFSFEFNRKYELIKCRGNWSDDCKPLW